jgi:hypothetical protein
MEWPAAAAALLAAGDGWLDDGDCTVAVYVLFMDCYCLNDYYIYVFKGYFYATTAGKKKISLR